MEIIFDVCRVDTCSSLDEAIRLIKAKPYDLVITDYNLNQPEQGALVGHTAKIVDPATKVIVMNSHVGDGENIRILSNADKYISKPFPLLPEFRVLINELIPLSE